MLLPLHFILEYVPPEQGLPTALTVCPACDGDGWRSFVGCAPEDSWCEDCAGTGNEQRVSAEGVA